MDDDLVEYFDYRGYHLPIYLDDPGQCYYTILDGEEIGFGSFNPYYQDDLKYLIDDRLDVIERFPEYGGKLQWFENGYQYRDLELFHRSRLVKVWLVEDPNKVDLEKIKSESIDILAKLEEFRLKRKQGTYLSDILNSGDK